MKYVYANLLGEWCNLSEDPDCVMGPQMVHPDQWWEEGAEIWAPLKRADEHTMYQLPYVYVHYKGIDYRIQPCHIQIVTR